MSFWDRLKGGLNSNPHPYVTSPQTFLEVDQKKVKRELKLTERGKERGARQLPGSDATGLDEVETEVTAQTKALLQNATDTMTAQEHTFADRLRDLGMEGRAQDIRARAQAAESDLGTAYHNGRDTLHSQRRAVVEAEEDLAQFQRTNGLQRQAHYPDNRWLPLSIIGLMVVLEAVFNAAIFGEGHSAGLIGGLVYAILISVLNVVIFGMLGAQGARNLQHVRPVRRGLGAAMLLAFVGLVGSINLLAAHLRRALQTPGDLEPSQRALESFLASPLDLHDAIAWIFVAVASAFAVLAAWKFYGLDDPYPHYGALDRRRAEREDGYADLKAELIDEMTEIRDARVAEMEDFKTQLENNVRLHGQILSHRATLRQQFQQYVDYLEEVANALLSTYRDANRAARETDPPPHFHARWVLPRTTVSGAAPEVVDVEAIRRTIKETADELEASLNRVEDLYRSHIRGYQTIEDLPKEKLHRAAKIRQAA